MELLAKVPWEIWVIILEASVIIGLILSLIISVKKKHKKEEMRSYVAEQSRDDRLRTALGNEYASVQVRDAAAKNVPFQVTYHDSPEKHRDAVCVQITQKSPLSTQKYIYNVHDVIRIGTDPQNEVVLKEPEAVACDAHLVRENNELYVKKMMSQSRMYFKRDKKNYNLNEKYIRLRSGDTLVVGMTSVEIEIINV